MNENKKIIKLGFVFLILCIISITITNELLVVYHNNIDIWYITVFPLIACSCQLILINCIKKIDSHIIIVYILFIGPIIAILVTNELGLIYGLIFGNFIGVSPNTSEKLPMWILRTFIESLNNILYKLREINFIIPLITIIMTILVEMFGFSLYYISNIIQKDDQLPILFPWITLIFYLSSRIVFLPLNDLNWGYWLLWIFGVILFIIYKKEDHNYNIMPDYWLLWGGILFVSNTYDLAMIETIINLIFGFNEYTILATFIILTIYFIFVWHYCYMQFQKGPKRILFNATVILFGVFLLLKGINKFYWQIIWVSITLILYSIIFFKITVKSNLEEIVWVPWLRYTFLLISILITGLIL